MTDHALHTISLPFLSFSSLMFLPVSAGVRGDDAVGAAALVKLQLF